MHIPKIAWKENEYEANKQIQAGNLMMYLKPLNEFSHAS